MTSIAMIYLTVCLCVIGFQIALIAGAPWGRITQGGQVDGALPMQGRVIAVVSIGLLVFESIGLGIPANLLPDPRCLFTRAFLTIATT